MRGEISLPFGRTETTSGEINDLTQSSKAVSVLEEQGIENAEEKVDSFLNKVPSLLEWLEENGRDYPWRRTTDPWKVYLAEILLQRTRADSVADIYPDFISNFPDPSSLKEADDSELENIVEKLGFVNHRIKTLKDVAKVSTKKKGKKVPDTIEGLKEPWRVGEYSARACQIFAREKPLALIDANIARVMGRILNYEMPSQPHKSEELYSFMEALMPKDPGVARAFNLALLDLGALVCTPENPKCEKCPFSEVCCFFRGQVQK